MRVEERDYQTTAVTNTFEGYENGSQSALIVHPTGTGKSVLSGRLAKKTLEVRRRTGRTLFLVHRYDLVRQIERTLTRMGLSVGVEMAHEVASKTADVVVGSVATLKGERLQRWPADHFDHIITDECHHAGAPLYRRIFEKFSGAWNTGVTATPNRGLGKIYQTVAHQYRFTQAVKDGWLCRIDPYAVKTDVNLKDIRTAGRGVSADFNSGELAERIAPHICALCEGMRKDLADRQTVVFVPDVGCAVATSQVLSDMGVPARWVAGGGNPKWRMKKSERKEILKAFDRLEFQVVVCADLLEEGWDCPPVSCVVNMRPTLSNFKYRQRAGRGTRLCDELGKTNTILLDFDWEANDQSRELCTPADLIDDFGDDDEEVKKEVRKRLVEKGGADSYTDLMKLIEDAERAVSSRRNLDIPILKVKNTYEKWIRDPSGVSKILGIKLNRSYDYDRHGTNPATPAQVNFLRFHKMESTEGLSKFGASKLISEIKGREARGMSTYPQIYALMRRGFDETLARGLSKNDASSMIDRLRKQEPRR